jgi:hypothetical protein
MPKVMAAQLQYSSLHRQPGHLPHVLDGAEGPSLPDQEQCPLLAELCQELRQ